jgi:hypothetical protein
MFYSSAIYSISQLLVIYYSYEVNQQCSPIIYINSTLTALCHLLVCIDSYLNIDNKQSKHYIIHLMYFTYIIFKSLYDMLNFDDYACYKNHKPILINLTIVNCILINVIFLNVLLNSFVKCNNYSKYAKYAKYKKD